MGDGVYLNALVMAICRGSVISVHQPTDSKEGYACGTPSKATPQQSLADNGRFAPVDGHQILIAPNYSAT